MITITTKSISHLSLFFITCASFSSVSVKGDCNVDEHHPENGGYFIEGIAGHANEVDPNSSSKGRLINSTWAPGVEYPDGSVVICEGMFCSEECKTNGCPVFIEGHTCSLIQFRFGLGSDVWLMPDELALANCDFSDATQLMEEPTEETTYNFSIEEDAELKTYLFASQKGCATGQRAAVRIADYDDVGLQCYGMGESSSRISKCTCSYEDRDISSLSEPCHSQFVAGCLSNAPVFQDGDDDSCCETGTCIGNHLNFDHPKGKRIEEERKKMCRNDIPGRCLSSSDDTFSDCCTKTCEQCGTDADPFYSWAQCLEGSGNNNTGLCGYSTSGHGGMMGSMEPYICDFSKCEKDHPWHIESTMFKNWIATVDPIPAVESPEETKMTETVNTDGDSQDHSEDHSHDHSEGHSEDNSGGNGTLMKQSYLSGITIVSLCLLFVASFLSTE